MHSRLGIMPNAFVEFVCLKTSLNKIAAKKFGKDSEILKNTRKKKNK